MILGPAVVPLTESSYLNSEKIGLPESRVLYIAVILIKSPENPLKGDTRIPTLLTFTIALYPLNYSKKSNLTGKERK